MDIESTVSKNNVPVFNVFQETTLLSNDLFGHTLPPQASEINIVDRVGEMAIKTLAVLCFF